MTWEGWSFVDHRQAGRTDHAGGWIQTVALASSRPVVAGATSVAIASGHPLFRNPMRLMAVVVVLLDHALWTEFIVEPVLYPAFSEHKSQLLLLNRCCCRLWNQNHNTLTRQHAITKLILRRQIKLARMAGKKKICFVFTTGALVFLFIIFSKMKIYFDIRIHELNVGSMVDSMRMQISLIRHFGRSGIGCEYMN